MELPKTVAAAYNALNPDLPIERGEQDPHYVDCSAPRGVKNAMEMMANRIERSPAPHYSKQLFTGHRGSGKSTELFRLKRMLEESNYFVVYFDVEAELNISDLDYTDVLLTIAQQVEKQMRECAKIEIKSELLDNIANWFGTTVIREQKSRDINATLETESSIGIQLPFAKMLARFKGEIKSSSIRRTEIRRELEQKALELIQRVNELLDDARVRLEKHGKRGLVLIVDGLERLLYRVVDAATGRSSHDLLFIEHGEQLRSPNCHLVYTFPINLLSARNVGQIFNETTILPMIKILEKDGEPCTMGLKALRQIIASRLDIDAIFDSPDLVDRLVQLSGGHLRDLLRLVRYALDYTNTTVSAEHVEQAMRQLVNEYDYLIPDKDLPLLHEVHRTRQVPNDEPHALLLYNLLVLEYRNGKRWAAIHPAVQATSRFHDFKPPKTKPKTKPKK